MIWQKEIVLPPYSKGIHIITNNIDRNLESVCNIGILHIFLKHTSAGLLINENADPSVLSDMERYFSDLVPEKNNRFTHIAEGSDDMPAHIKSAIIGQSLTIPITNGKLSLGTWQGIFLYEFRNKGGSRRIILTVYF